MTEFVDVQIGDKTYRLHKFKPLAGRAIVTQYPITAILHNKQYESNEAVMLKLMAHVSVHLEDGSLLALSTRDLIDNHVKDWNDLVRIEMESLKYNCPFLTDAFAGNLADTLGDRVTEYLVDLFASAVEKMKDIG